MYIGLIQILFEVDGKTFRGLWIRSFVSRGTAQQISNLCKREEYRTTELPVTLIFCEKGLFLQRATQKDVILYLMVYIFKRQAAKALILGILFLHIHLQIKASETGLCSILEIVSKILMKSSYYWVTSRFKIFYLSAGIAVDKVLHCSLENRKLVCLLQGQIYQRLHKCAYILCQ